MTSILELVTRAQAHDAKALTELYRASWRPARAAAYGVTGDIAASEDAAAEGLDLALGGLRHLRDPARFDAWLRRIVVRAARRQRRRERRLAESVLTEASPTPDAEASIERAETARLVRDAVEHLPPQLREVIALHYFEGAEVESAARFLRVPIGTFKRRLHEARAALARAAAAILDGRPVLDPKREHLDQAITAVLAANDEAGTHRVIKLALEVRPYPRDLMARLVRGTSDRAGAASIEDVVRRAFDRGLGAPSLGPGSPLERAMHAIREALPAHELWAAPTADEMVASMRALMGGSAKPSLPPGFAEGRPGMALRLSRALVHVRSGTVEHPRRLVEESADWASFRSGLADAGASVVLDLFWLERRAITSAEVESLLARLAATLLPETPHRIASGSAPRYRVEVRLELAGALAASGGVSARELGQPAGADVAHVRVYLEAWAALLTGEHVPMERFGDLAARLRR